MNNTDANREILRGSHLMPIANGKLMVTGPDVDKVLSSSLEHTLNPAGGGILGVDDAFHEPKVQFSPRLRSDGMWDERFIARDQLDETQCGPGRSFEFSN